MVMWRIGARTTSSAPVPIRRRGAEASANDGEDCTVRGELRLKPCPVCNYACLDGDCTNCKRKAADAFARSFGR
jgi:hypothetical protein